MKRNRFLSNTKLGFMNMDYRLRLFILVLIFIVIIYFVFNEFTKPHKPPILEIQNASEVGDETIYKFFEELDLTAESVYVYDINNKDILYEKNSNILQPIASIAKLFVAFSLNNYIHPDDVSVITYSDYNKNSSRPLEKGSRWNTSELLKFSLVVSSNAGIDSVVSTVSSKTGLSFSEIIRESLRSYSLNQSFLINASGLDVNDYFAGAEASAQDVAKLFELLIENAQEISEETTTDSKTYVNLDGLVFEATNTNAKLILKEDILLSKTGFTDIAGGNLAVVVSINDRRFIIVVLGSRNKTTRIDDVDAIIQTIKSIYSKIYDSLEAQEKVLE